MRLLTCLRVMLLLFHWTMTHLSTLMVHGMAVYYVVQRRPQAKNGTWLNNWLAAQTHRERTQATYPLRHYSDAYIVNTFFVCRCCHWIYTVMNVDAFGGRLATKRL